jgi:hypothetical protein
VVRGDTFEKFGAWTLLRCGDIGAILPVNSSDSGSLSAPAPSNHLVTGKFVVFDRVPARTTEFLAVFYLDPDFSFLFDISRGFNKVIPFDDITSLYVVFPFSV